MYKILLDAGHGGYDFGSVHGERIEKDETLNLVLAIGELLENAGIEVVYTRTYDKYMTADVRAQIANEENANLFISIHKNYSEKPNTYSGVQTIVSDSIGLENVIAEKIHQRLNDIGLFSIGIDEINHVDVLKKTKMPAMIIKVGFINTEPDNMLYDEKFADIASSIANSILEVIGTILNDEIPTYKYRIQVGTYRMLSNAINLQRKLNHMGYSVYLSKENEYYYVYVGEYYKKEEALTVLNDLNQRGLEGIVVAL